MVDFSLWDIFRNLLLAARWTVLLSLIAFIGGGLVGLALLFARIAKLRGADMLVGGYVQLFQGTPLLMQLFLAYFGLALFGINVSPWVAAALALTLYTSAFLTEIWPHTAEPSMTMMIWLTSAGQTRFSEGGRTTRVNTCSSESARLCAASIWPFGVVAMPARTISAA